MAPGTPVEDRGRGSRFAVQAAAGVVGPHEHEAAGVVVRQGPEEHGVRDAEQRRVGADAERERQHGREREAGRAPQTADTDAQILTQRAEDRFPPAEPDFGFGGFEAAHPRPGGSRRSVGGQSPSNLLLGREREVVTELVVQIAVGGVPEEQPAQSRDERAPERHGQVTPRAAA